MLFRWCVISLFAAMTAACDTVSMRENERGLYRLLHGPDARAVEAVRRRLESAVYLAQANGSPIAPGLRAALAFHVARAGDRDRAAELLRAERAEFPRAAPFLDRLEASLLGVPAEQPEPEPSESLEQAGKGQR